MLCLTFIFLMLFYLFFQGKNSHSYVRILIIMELFFLLLILCSLYINTSFAAYLYIILFAVAAVDCAISVILIYYIFK